MREISQKPDSVCDKHRRPHGRFLQCVHVFTAGL